MPIYDPKTLEFFSRSPEQTRRIGMRLGGLARVGDLICLDGDLGSGKTTLTQGIARGWGSLDPVTSPTFVLVNEYARPDGSTLYHFDAYRLSGSLDAEDLDIDYMLARGCLVVEWPERVREALPKECIWVAMRWISDERRGLVITSSGTRYGEFLSEFRQKTFGG